MGKRKGHFQKHQKHYTRFILFFAFMVVYNVVEDVIALMATGMSLDFIFRSEHFIMVTVIAIVFTAIAELIKKLFEKNKK